MSQRLVRTMPDSLPPGLADRIAELCNDRRDVEAAWLCAVETDAQEQRLQLGIKLRTSVSRPEDLGHQPMELIRAVTAVDPGLLRELPLAILADRAVPAWESRGILIFRR